MGISAKVKQTFGGKNNNVLDIRFFPYYTPQIIRQSVLLSNKVEKGSFIFRRRERDNSKHMSFVEFFSISGIVSVDVKF